MHDLFVLLQCVVTQRWWQGIWTPTRTSWTTALYFQSTLLHIAARNGRLQVAVELLKRGIDVNALDYVSPATTLEHNQAEYLTSHSAEASLAHTD